jgi:signal transduction histidine kinase
MDDKKPLIDLLIHDLTGPLSVVSSSVNNLLKKESSCGPITERQKETLKRILRNTNKARALLQEMVEVYRSEEGLFKKDRISVQKILKEALLDAVEIIDPDMADKLSLVEDYGRLQEILEENGVFLRVTGKYCVEPFVHDQKKIQQILRNLITNALKYRREKIWLTVSGDEDLQVSVKDDGSGIPKERRDDIFKRFPRLENEPRAGVEGLGFGLSCVKALVATMKGEITLESGEGAGTSFRVRIPPL